MKAVRALSQSGLYPSNCRLLDPELAKLYGAAGEGGGAVLVLGFESAHHPVDHWMEPALECCADYGGKGGRRTVAARTVPQVMRHGVARFCGSHTFAISCFPRV